MVGSAFMLVGIIATAILARRDIGHVTFDLVEIAEHANFAASTGRWLFFAFAIAFAIKVPLFPFHTWLPDAHTQAPTAGSVILAGVMLKLGTYGLLRFGVYLFPEAAHWARPLMLTLAVIGITYGAIAATMQKDLKRLVAYSSVAHLGFIVLGMFALTAEAISGGVLQNVNHGISTGALFLLVGLIYERRHTREISKLKGLQSVAPVFAAAFMVVMLSSIGLPGLNGFVGEFTILVGSFKTARWWVVVATTGVILAALYLLWAYQRVFHGVPDEDNKTFAELRWKEGLVLLRRSSASSCSPASTRSRCSTASTRASTSSSTRVAAATVRPRRRAVSYPAGDEDDQHRDRGPRATPRPSDHDRSGDDNGDDGGGH